MHDNKHESEIMKTIQISNANVNIYDLSWPIHSEVRHSEVRHSVIVRRRFILHQDNYIHICNQEW